MRLKVWIPLLVALAALAPPARADHCGACANPPAVHSPDQLCPPLVVSKDEIDLMVTIVDESLSLAEREFGFA